ncbi:MAG TPA: hypothetical protein VNO30_23330 [Kofleriaceae bacterium]|nr:hypothetical protein [Kofleriaceae bacterium]
MRASWILGSLIVSLTIAGTRPAAAQGKAAEPAELLMSVGIGPDSTLDSLRAFANTIQPGVGIMVTVPMLRKQIASMVTATSIDGLDEQSTIYVLAVDGGPALKGVAALGKVADEARLKQGVGQAHLVKKNGWAVIGPKPIAEKIAPFALGTLSAQAITGLPVATVYTANLMVRYKTEIAEARKKLLDGAGAAGGQMAGMMQAYFDGLLSALADSERAIVTFDATKDVAAADLALVPKAGSRLGKFIGAQQPADYGLVAKLPAAQAPVLVAGHLDAGPYRASLLELSTMMFGSGTAAGITAAVGALFKAASGDFAMAMQMGGPKGMELTQLFGISDEKAGSKAMDQLFDALKKPLTTTMMGMTTTQTLNPKPATHDGVTIRTIDITYDLSKAPPDTKAAMEKMIAKSGAATRTALFDKLGLVVMAADGGAGATAAIDAVRGKGKRYAPPAQVTDFLAGSRVRKESVAMIADIGAAMGLGAAGRTMMLSMGFADKRAHFRLALPAATIRGFAGGMP